MSLFSQTNHNNGLNPRGNILPGSNPSQNITALNERIQDLQNKLHESKEKNEDLNEANQNLEAQNQSLVEENERLHNKIERLTKQVEFYSSKCKNVDIGFQAFKSVENTLKEVDNREDSAMKSRNQEFITSKEEVEIDVQNFFKETNEKIKRNIMEFCDNKIKDYEKRTEKLEETQKVMREIMEKDQFLEDAVISNTLNPIIKNIEAVRANKNKFMSLKDSINSISS